MAATEFMDLSNSESPHFTGRAVAALAVGDDMLRLSGRVLIAVQLARHYGFTDIDGCLPSAIDGCEADGAVRRGYLVRARPLTRLSVQPMYLACSRRMPASQRS